MKQITIIGDGGWGTALGLVLHKNGHAVRIWGPFEDYIVDIQTHNENRKFLPGIPCPTDIEWTADPTTAMAGTDAVILAIPSKFYRDVVIRFAPLLKDCPAIASVTKGLDRDTHHRMTETASTLLDGKAVAALSGPSHAEEVAKGAATAVVAACADHSVAEVFQTLFNCDVFRVYTSDDVVGVELGGALKNVIAIAAGVCDGIGFGDNSKAALITRGLAEITRLGVALGAHPATFSGLSGMGDLIVTCVSQHSRNRRVGERLGQGQTLDEIMAQTEQVAEGVWNSANAKALAAETGVEVPITDEVYAVLHEGKDPRAAVTDLLTRDPRPERDE